MKPTQLSVILIALAFCSCGNEKSTRGVNNAMPDVVDYNLHIKPILSDRCFACHGPDKNAMKAGLALYTEGKAYAELEENPGRYAIVPGKAGQSEVVKRITATDEEQIMPPIESNLTLNGYEKELIIKWIEQGAVYKPHWSLIPVEKPQIPQVDNEDWVSNPIDNFILAKMKAKGLSPEEMASKEKLIRRVSFDLTGLPPTIVEIDNFLNDSSGNAYEKVVDGLLGSVAYGERMASRWLDISRYADTHGYQDDFYRSMWPWREWVIEAYNENLPFDEFLTWQMAGDLLPNSTYGQKLATGFNRNHSINQEGGILVEEFNVEYVADRTNTLGAAVLGLTVECARCHDHKYDPISQKEYYQLYSFFNNVPMESEKGFGIIAPGPSIEYPEDKLNELRAYLAGINKSYTEVLMARKEEVFRDPLGDKGFVSWLESKKAEENAPPPVLSNAKACFSFENLDDSTHPSNWNIQDKEQRLKTIRPKTGKYGKGLFVGKGQNYSLGPNKYINETHPFTISFWFYNRITNGKDILVKLDQKTKKGIKIESQSGFVNISTSSSDKDVGSVLTSAKIIPNNKWVHITVAYNGNGTLNGFTLYVNGEHMELSGDKDRAFSNVTENSILEVGELSGTYGSGMYVSGIDEVYLFDHELKPGEVQSLYRYDPIDVLPQNGFEPLTKEEKLPVVNHFLYHIDRGFKIALRNLEAANYKKIHIPDESDVRAMTMAELPEPNKAYVLNRGAYDAPGEEVFPGTPKSILGFDESLPKNRLGLAQWLVDPKNPLTSRVAVNRYWQYLFGKGIVKTVDDFGNQGALPSHPELIDWLAATFMENGWDTKAMIKLMVMSSTYRQSSACSDEKRKTDPENTYLARSPRYRMDAEMVRDQALAASGLLNRKVGGPSVYPYQPENLWLAVAGNFNGLIQYVPDVSEEQYRRSLYTIWKRTVPPPAMLSFDAATRDRCVVSRQSTNTPLQALVLLNDPQYMEAARAMAQNLLATSQAPEENFTTAFRKLTGRKPEGTELTLLMDIYKEELISFKENPKLAGQLLQIGDYPIDKNLDQDLLAAHTFTISAILNLDETISKE